MAFEKRTWQKQSRILERLDHIEEFLAGEVEIVANQLVRIYVTGTSQSVAAGAKGEQVIAFMSSVPAGYEPIFFGFYENDKKACSGYIYSFDPDNDQCRVVFVNPTSGSQTLRPGIWILCQKEGS